jgi:DNA-binding NarL/FixJ family response regulator
MQKVFLVEDSPLVLERLKDLLTDVAGAQIVGEAGTASAAIAGILDAQPDIALLDLNLAEGSGLDVLRALHARMPQVAFYMLSNFSAYPYRELAQRLGASGYFDKTKDFERMRELVARRAANAVKGESPCLQSSC